MDMNTSLLDSLKNHQELLSYGMSLVNSTKELFDTYGKDILTSSYDRFAALEKSLSSKDIRMVVIGEFSRGKSSLLNALLGITELPAANEATTAINTFVYGLQDKNKKPYLNIIFRDGHTERIEIKSENQDELRKWGTELDTENRDPRKEVDYIDLFIDHPLLNLGLVLIDTPGLESMQKHHEEITRRAIDTAHIAIWVQSTTQLGGNAREWSFLTETIRKSFRKFLTVVNMWDLVLDPQDEQDKCIPGALREKKKMDVVRGQFRKAFSGTDVSEDEINCMVSDENLFGVSARWALQGTPEQKEKSGLKKLSERIRQICTGEEAKKEIFYKPMKQLQELQDKLGSSLKDMQQALENEDSLEQQKRDCEILDLEIKQLEQNMKLSIAEAKEDHIRIRDECIKDVITEIAEPLRDLKQEIDNQVTVEYVREQVLNKVDSINLPPNLQDTYKETLIDINNKWSEEREHVSDMLQELRIDYAKEMNKHVGNLSDTLDGLDINLPEMDISCNIDFGMLEKFYSEKMEIQKDIESYEKEIAKYEENIAKESSNEQLVRNAKEAVSRMERRLLQLGPQPQPLTRQESHKVSDGGIYSSPEYRTVEVPDYTPVKEWKEQKAQIEGILSDKEKALERVIREEEEKSGRRLSMEMAKRRVEQQLEKMLARQNGTEQKQQQEFDSIVERTHRQLILGTSGQLEKYARLLEKNATEGLAEIFDHQLEYLQKCVTEQFMEPLRSKEASRKEALQLFEQGRANIEERKTQLQEALQKLQELQQQTANCVVG